MMSRFSFWLSLLLVSSLVGPVRPSELAYVSGSTRKVCQLTGDVDKSSGMETLSRTASRFGLTATDLGSSFEHKGKLYFLFGDTWGRPGDRDALGWTVSRNPEKINLDFFKAEDGKWLPLTIPGIRQGAFEIPSGGISIDGAMYVVFTTDHSPEKTMGRSILARSRDDGRTFERLYDLSTQKFINASVWQSDGWVYLFGSGAYRQSSPYLARIRPRRIGDKSQWQYLTGPDAGGVPSWQGVESEAAPLFRHDVIGEFSVTYLEPWKRWVMLYNSHAPRGITMRSAPAPWGPWSEGTVVFEPFRDGGYGKYMNIPASAERPQSGPHDPGREKEWGGEYGPYVMSRYTSIDGPLCTLYYTMSIWNPYQVVVMRSDLELK